MAIVILHKYILFWLIRDTIYLQGRMTKRKKERRGESKRKIPSLGSLPRCPQEPSWTSWFHMTSWFQAPEASSPALSGVFAGSWIGSDVARTPRDVLIEHEDFQSTGLTCSTTMPAPGCWFSSLFLHTSALFYISRANVHYFVVWNILLTYLFPD